MIARTQRLSDGGTVRLLEAGSGAPVLLIHGVGLRAEAWAPQIDALASLARVVAVDMPGHGESTPLSVGARLPEFVAWAARVIESLNVGPLSVAGHSMGALVAKGLAVEHPNLVRRVALLNTVYCRSEESRAAVLARAEDIQRGASGIDGPLNRWFGPDDTPVRAQVADWLRTVDHQGYATAYRAFAEGDRAYADRLGAIRCPALVLTGEEDGNSTPEMARAMAEAIPLGEARMIKGQRHMMNLTAPKTVSRILTQWLQTGEDAP
jgi:pimeloyl-ACP methyl ester carboxylesterase